MILDAKNQILGRFSSELAKELQKGTEIIVLNAQESIVSGEKVQLQTEYKFNIEHKLRKGRYVKLGEISKHLGSKVTL